MKFISIYISLLLLAITPKISAQASPVQPYGALPSASQLEWQKMEFYMFVHFGPNTFTDVEWGNGQEDPKVFNPSALDCSQWVAVAKAAGMKGIIITAKHHDGFCLFPSKYSTHTVRESGWKNGQGDVLRELSNACKEGGLKFGVYLSPWDRNHPSYGTPEYNQLFANTLNEVLSGYGSVFEQWFDGANGDGTKHQVYDWPLFHSVVYKNQPQAVIFSDIGPGCRWMGNEEGIAGATNWSRLNIDGFEPGHKAPSVDTLNRGNIAGKYWVPAETDVSIRPGWFYSPSTNDKVKTVNQLAEIYEHSVGRNSNLLLNVPADRSGRIHASDSARLREFRTYLDKVYTHNLAQGAHVQASSYRGKDKKYSAQNIVDENYDSYWATDDKTLAGSLLIELKSATSFNRLMLQEYIPLGQRIEAFTVEYWNLSSKKWEDLTQGTTIGYKRILSFEAVKTNKVRIHITKSLACPVINNVGLYLAPMQMAAPSITRNKQGMVSILSDNPSAAIYYSLDGSVPGKNSQLYSSSFSLPRCGIVQAVAISKNGDVKSDITKESFDLAPTNWQIVAEDPEKLSKIIDGNFSNGSKLNTGEPIIINFGSLLTIKGFFYIPVNDVNAPNIHQYSYDISTDGKNWTKVLSGQIFNNMKNNPIRQDVLFKTSKEAQYIRFTPEETVNGDKTFSINELGIITR